MHSLLLHGVMRLADAHAASASAPSRRYGLRSIDFDDMSAMVGSAPRHLPSLRPERLLARQLVEYQARLEDLQQFGDVLPSTPRVRFPDPDAVRVFLAGNADSLRQALSELAGKAQYQVMISSADQSAAQSRPRPRMVNRQSIRVEDLQASDKSTPAPILPALFSVESDLSQDLNRVTDDWIDLPRDASASFMNRVFLVQKDRTGLLEAVLEDFDRAFVDTLRVRLVGPSPPVSFARIEVSRIGRQSRAMAHRCLGVDAELHGEALLSARRQVLRRATKIGGPSADILQAARFLEVCGKAQMATAALTSKSSDADLWVAEILREGQSLRLDPAQFAVASHMASS